MLRKEKNEVAKIYKPKELEPYIIEYGPDLKRLVNDAIIDI